MQPSRRSNQRLIEDQEEELKQREEESREETILARISEAVEEAKKIPADQIRQLVSMMRCLGDKMDMAEFYTEPSVYEALSCLKEALSSGSPTEIVDHVYKLLSKSLETPFGLSIDYETLFMTLEKLSLAQFTSPLAESSGAATTLKTKSVSKKISFFIPSEILPLDGVVSKTGTFFFFPFLRDTEAAEGRAT